MAIIKSFPGIEAVVLVNKAKAQEYIDEHSDTREQSDEQCQRFIESIDDAEFAVRVLINDEYKFINHDALGIKVHVDGEYRCSAIWHEDQPAKYLYLHGSKVAKADGGSSILMFKFTAIKTVDGKGTSQERDLILKQKEDTKATGEITVTISRLRIKEEKKGLAGNGGKTTENKHSKLFFKANFAKRLTHGTGFGGKMQSSKAAVKFTCTPIDGPNSPIATFCFMYRAKNVLDDLNVTAVSEDLASTIRKDSGQSVEQGPVGIAEPIKDEPNAINDNATGDIYGATPLRQLQPPAHAASPPPAGNMAVFQNLLLSLGLTDEQKEILAQQLRNGVNNTAQNLQTPRPNSQPIVPEVAQDSVHIKQEGGEVTDGRRGMSITTPRRTNYQERQTGDGGIEIDLTTPIQETFIKPDPDVNVQAAQETEDTVMTEQDPSISSAPVQSVANDATTTTLAPAFPNLEATQAAVRASIEKNNRARQGSMSTADGIATPMTPDAPLHEPDFERAEDTQMDNADQLQSEKPVTPKELLINFDADIIASIETDQTSSVAETIASRKDSILSDVSMDLNGELQRARSGHPTITTVHSAGEVRSAALSPAPQPTEILGVASREATEGIPVETVDIDLTTGRDIREHSFEDDSASPSRQLMPNLDSEGNFVLEYSPIKGVEHTIIGTPLPAAKKPTEGFEASLTVDNAQITKVTLQTAEAPMTTVTSEKPIISFEEAMARAKSKKATQPAENTERATTPFPSIPADVEVPATPTATPEDVALPASDMHNGDHGFIDLESIVSVPETPVKHTTPHALTKNDLITTPTTSKGTPNTLDRLLSASRKDMADMDLNVNTPSKRLFGNKDRTPSSQFGVKKVGAPVTGNARGSGETTSPIKRERDDEENEIAEVDTPTKKMKYLQLGSKNAPISFDSDEELPEAGFEPVQITAEVSRSEFSKSGDVEVTNGTAQAQGDAQNEREKSCSMM